MPLRRLPGPMSALPFAPLAPGERRLTLLRHAKSSWDEPGVDDRDRPLNARGERDAPAMGRHLARLNFRPTFFLTSPATRARHTAQIVARELGYPAEFLQREPELYLATPEAVCAVVAREAGNLRDVVVCGHNPGLTELANRLVGAGALDNLPTCGVFSVTLKLRNWSDLDGARGELACFTRPKDLA
jgi:phosphohistidine phosphatase